MRFDRIRLRNFKPYDEVDLRLSEGVTVIHGPNGGGKSSLLEACFFALYGAKAIDGTLDDVVTNGTDETEVELSFTHDGSSYRVHRELRRYGGDVGTRTCVLEGDGLEEPIEGATDVGAFVTDLLRMDNEAFINCAYVRQGEVNKLINATPRERQRMIDDLLQLGTLEEYRERASDARLGVEDVLGEKRGSLETVESQIDAKEDRNLEERLNERESELSTVDAEIERFEENRQKAEETLERANEVLETYEEKREELAELETDVEGLETAVKEGQREREQLTDEIADVEERVVNLETVIEDRLAETELEQGDEEAIESRVADLDERETQLRDRLQEVREEETETRGSLKNARERVTEAERLLEQGKCPECGQPVDGSPHVNAIEEERQRAARLEKTASELETKREKLETEIEELETKRERLADLRELQTKLDEAKQRIDTLEERRESRADLIEERRERLAEKRERRDELRDSFDEDRVQEARDQKESAREYLDKVEAKLEELDQRRSDLQTKIGGIKQDMKELEQLRDRRADLEGRVDALEALRDEASDLETLYGDLRAELRQRNVESLERTLNETFELVYGNDAYSRIDLDGEYQLTVYQKDGEPLDPEQLSGGERALFNLSLRCAIYRLLAAGIDGTAPTPPLILDEPTVFLDSGHVSRLVELVEEMRSFGVAQIIIVSHDDELVGAADDLVRVEKNPTTNRSRVQRVENPSMAGFEPGAADD